MFRYRLHGADGEDAGEAAYAVTINPGDEILTMQEGKLQTLRVLDLVPVPEESSAYDGLLRVEAA
jgi:hypothetical protein